MSTSIRPAITEAFERQLMNTDREKVEAWKHYLDAPGAPPLNEPEQRWAMARILDTSSKVLKTMEATQQTSVFGTNYDRALLGMTRQIFPRLLGTRLVSVQPMDRPTGQIFHLTVARDDDSTLGYQPYQNMTGLNSTTMLASRTYADAGTQGSASAGENVQITKGMKLAITSTNVEIGNAKKLKTEATMELVQDLQAYHNLNALDLLQAAAVDEIAQEIDALIVKAVYDAAVAHKTVTFGGQPPTGETWTNGSWRKQLQRAILLADNAIYLASGRRPNVLVCGPQAYLELVDLNTFAMSSTNWSDSGTYGIVPVGTLMQQYEVLMSRYIPANELLLVRRGQGFLDAGIVYAPYLALFVSERVFDVTYQRTAQSFASRFGIFTISNTLYARVVINPTAQGIA